LSEDPWFAAQKFIDRHELNQIFLDQIAQFIINNTKGESITAQSSTYVDPFTGASKYTPGDSERGQTSTSTGSAYYDPFTGQSRYTPSESSRPVAAQAPSRLTDPFTGTNAYYSSGTKEVVNARNAYYPQESFVLFDQKNVQSILNKIKEFEALNNINAETSDLIEKLANMDTSDLNKKIETLFNLINNWTKGWAFINFSLFYNCRRLKHLIWQKKQYSPCLT
jgi:phospholipase A-2-activating protein